MQEGEEGVTRVPQRGWLEGKALQSSARLRESADSEDDIRRTQSIRICRTRTGVVLLGISPELFFNQRFKQMRGNLLARKAD